MMKKLIMLLVVIALVIGGILFFQGAWAHGTGQCMDDDYSLEAALNQGDEAAESSLCKI